MRGLYTPLTQIRREVFIAVSKAAYEGYDLEQYEEIPYQIITGEVPQYRDSVYRERAIVTERVRLAMNMDLRPSSVPSASLTYQMDLDGLKVKPFTKEQMRVIPAACNACEEKSFFVSNQCHGCIAHPCMVVCPVGAISLQNGHAFIDQETCIKCGKCYQACPYNSIVKNERPCVAACGVNAFRKDNLNRAVIDTEACVSCGQCMVNCPFGAIMDKSQIYQVISAMQSGVEVSAIVAPAFVGQFGDDVSAEQVFEGIRQLGFTDVLEVAYGADFTTVEEAKHYVEHVPNDQPFLATSCCPAWVTMAKHELKEKSDYVSPSYSPMGETAKAIKKKLPNTKICFIGPCSAKKQEAASGPAKEFVDYVLTFEELYGMLIAKEIDLDALPVSERINDASKDGRGFAVSGGVAKAVERTVRQLDPTREMLIERAEGLSNCRKMVLMAKAGKRNGYLLEGMACPGGCVGGAGTIINQNKANGCVQTYANQSAINTAVETVNRNK